MAERTTIELKDVVGPAAAHEITMEYIRIIVRERPGLTVAELNAEMIRRGWLAPDVTAEDAACIGLAPTDSLHPGPNLRRGRFHA